MLEYAGQSGLQGRKPTVGGLVQGGQESDGAGLGGDEELLELRGG